MKESKFLLINFVYAFIGLIIPLTAPIMAQTGDSGKATSLNDTGKMVLTGWGSNETGQLYHMNYSSLTPSVGLDVRVMAHAGAGQSYGKI